MTRTSLAPSSALTSVMAGMSLQRRPLPTIARSPLTVIGVYQQPSRAAVSLARPLDPGEDLTQPAQLRAAQFDAGLRSSAVGPADQDGSVRRGGPADRKPVARGLERL